MDLRNNLRSALHWQQIGLFTRRNTLAATVPSVARLISLKREAPRSGLRCRIVDFRLSTKRDGVKAKAFFRKVLPTNGRATVSITLDGCSSLVSSYAREDKRKQRLPFSVVSTLEVVCLFFV